MTSKTTTVKHVRQQIQQLTCTDNSKQNNNNNNSNDNNINNSSNNNNNNNNIINLRLTTSAYVIWSKPKWFWAEHEKFAESFNVSLENKTVVRIVRSLNVPKAFSYNSEVAYFLCISWVVIKKDVNLQLL